MLWVLNVIPDAVRNSRDGQGRRRLDSNNDYVCIEIEMALKREIPVIPLLVSRATMPREEQLPNSLQPLVYRQAIEIRRDPDFHIDMDRLIRAVDGMLKKTGEGHNHTAKLSSIANENAPVVHRGVRRRSDGF